MNGLKAMGLFLGGAIVGGIATGYVVKNKYEQLIDEEVASVKEVYKNRTGIDEAFIARKEIREEDLMENCEIEKVATADDIKAYNKNKKDNSKHDYTRYHKKSVKVEVQEENGEFTELSNVIEITENQQFIPPTLIDEEEVGMHGYDMKVLTYYSDNVLADESDTVLDIETYIGLDNAKLFDENPGCQSMFVRNEQTGIDYEVQRDDLSWEDFALHMGIDQG